MRRIWNLRWNLRPLSHGNKEEESYLDVHMRHEHGEVGEVRAGAGGVRPVGAQQATVLHGPVARHGFLRVAPERAVGVEVLLGVLRKKNKTGAVRQTPAE